MTGYCVPAPGCWDNAYPHNERRLLAYATKKRKEKDSDLMLIPKDTGCTPKQPPAHTPPTPCIYAVFLRRVQAVS